MEVSLEDSLVMRHRGDTDEDTTDTPVAAEPHPSAKPLQVSLDNLPDFPVVRNGIFCFQVIREEGVHVRQDFSSYFDMYHDDGLPRVFSPLNSMPTVDDDDRLLMEVNKPTAIANEDYRFQRSELVEADQIISCASIVLCRLADHTGWMAVEWKGLVAMREVAVSTGLWSWYVDNFPRGITVRRHPLDSAALLPTEARPARLYPLQKVYCDCRVVHPVTGVSFYRLQSFAKQSHSEQSAALMNSGWVYDRTPRPDAAEEDLIWLLPTDLVQTDLLSVYMAKETCKTRMQPTTSLKVHHEGIIVEAGEMVVVQTVRKSPYSVFNGPFLRLADGSGWLYEFCQGQRIMESVPVERGLWECRIMNKPVGLGLRRQPVDGQGKLYPDTVFPYRCILQCDAKVVHPVSEVPFYRVRGTEGWLLGMRDGIDLIQVLSSTPGRFTDQDEWTADFCRGVASTVPGLQEAAHYSYSNVIKFVKDQEEERLVFLKTRTVGRCRKGKPMSLCGRGCTAAELRLYLGDDDVSDAEAGEEKKEDYLEQQEELTEENEEELRRSLVAMDSEIANLQSKRRVLCEQLCTFDEFRVRMAKEMTYKLPVVVLNCKSNVVSSNISSSSSELEDASTLLSQSSESTTEEEKEQTAGTGLIGGLMARMKNSSGASSRGTLEIATINNNSTNNHTVNSGFSITSDKRLPFEANSPRSNHISPLKSTRTRDTNRSDEKRSTPQRVVYVCGECDRIFNGRYSRDIHCREAHGLFCTKCEAVFPTQEELTDHLREKNHWL